MSCALQPKHVDSIALITPIVLEQCADSTNAVYARRIASLSPTRNTHTAPSTRTRKSVRVQRGGSNTRRQDENPSLGVTKKKRTPGGTRSPLDTVAQAQLGAVAGTRMHVPDLDDLDDPFLVSSPIRTNTGPALARSYTLPPAPSITLHLPRPLPASPEPLRRSQTDPLLRQRHFTELERSLDTSPSLKSRRKGKPQPPSALEAKT